jgi:hypothetical protein
MHIFKLLIVDIKTKSNHFQDEKYEEIFWLIEAE